MRPLSVRGHFPYVTSLVSQLQSAAESVAGIRNIRSSQHKPHRLDRRLISD